MLSNLFPVSRGILKKKPPVPELIQITQLGKNLLHWFSKISFLTGQQMVKMPKYFQISVNMLNKW